MRSEYNNKVQALWVDRRNPDNPVQSLMLTKDVLAVLPLGAEVDLLAATALKKEDLPFPLSVNPIVPEELSLKARWLTCCEEQSVSGSDANVFGGLGVFALDQSVSSVVFPTMNALAVPGAFLERYGAFLLPITQPFGLEKANQQEVDSLFLIQYEWHPAYIREYVMHPQGGGGLSIEKHPFPHLFVPLASQCSGGLILAQDQHNGFFTFISIQIPFGYAVMIRSDVIHSDSFFVGPYAIGLTCTDKADAVILKRDTVEREIIRVDSRI